jgi:hypothetical protein
MTNTRVVSKNLAGEEDLLYGEGQVVQSRNGGNFNITQIRTIYPANSLAERDALDTDRFKKCAVYDGSGSVDFYEFDGADWVLCKIPTELHFATVAELKASTTVQVGDFVTIESYTVTNNSGTMFGKIVAGGTGTDDGGLYIDLTASSLQFKRVSAEPITPQEYGAEADGVTDDTVAVNKAMTNSSYMLRGSYAVSASVIINSETNGLFNNAELVAVTNDFDVLVAKEKRDFETQGVLRVTGPDQSTPESGTGAGLSFFDSNRYTMSTVIVTGLKDGIVCDGTTVPAGLLAGFRGRQGRWVMPTVYKCGTGIQVLRRSEYTLWEAPQVTQNTEVGFVQEAGNTNVVGGNIQDNQNGVLLQGSGSGNACHGMFTSVSINHNIGFNLKALDVELGHTINGCHIYGDSAAAGTIDIIGSTGINICNGIIDAQITLDDTGSSALAGWNNISNNHIEPNYAVLIDATGTSREKTVVKDNFEIDGDAWGFNDSAFVSVRADQSGEPSQVIPDSVLTTVILGSEREDNRKQYDATTGVFTALYSQLVTVSTSIQVAFSGGTFTDGYIGIYRGSTVVAFLPLVATAASGTFAVSNGSITLSLQSSDTISVRAYVNATAGTISITNDEATNISITSANS